MKKKKKSKKTKEHGPKKKGPSPKVTKIATEGEMEKSQRRTKSTKGRNRIIKLALVLIIILAVIAVALIGFAPQEYLTVSEITSNKSLYINKDVDLRGKVLTDSIDEGNRSFLIGDDKASMKVTYKDVLPEGFGEGKDIVVTGKLKNNGIFDASEITVGCPSKYENR